MCAGTQAMLRRIVLKILEQPDEPRFRRLRLANPAIATKLVPVPGALACLEAIGFQRQQHKEAAAEEQQQVEEFAHELFMPAEAVQPAVLQAAARGLLDDVGTGGGADVVTSHQQEGPPPPVLVSWGRLPPAEEDAGNPRSVHTWRARFMEPYNRGVYDIDDDDACMPAPAVHAWPCKHLSHPKTRGRAFRE